MDGRKQGLRSGIPDAMRDRCGKGSTGFGAFDQLLQFFANKKQPLDSQYLPRFEAGAFDVQLRDDGSRSSIPESPKRPRVFR